MTEGYKLCEWCGEEIEQGRSDKRFCDKRCYNHYKNHENRNTYGRIKNNLEAYKSSYRALSRLIKRFGNGTKIKLSTAVQMGLNRKSPCLVVQFKDQEGTFSQIGNIAYQASSDLKYIQIHIISDGSSN